MKMITSIVEILRLDEVRGRIRDLDNILGTFKTIFQKKVQEISEFPATIVITEQDLGRKFFFGRISIQISIRKGLASKATGSLLTRGMFVGSDKKLENVEIDLNVVWDQNDSIETITDMVASDFSHEITHAYEEYERLLRGAPSLGEKNYIEKYKKVRTEAQNSVEHIVKSILYFIDKTEQKAFLAEFYSEARRLLASDHTIQSANDLYKKLVGTEKVNGKTSFTVTTPAQSQVGRSYQACKELMWRWNGGQLKGGDTIYDKADLRDAENRLYGDKSDWRQESLEFWNDLYGTSVQSVGDLRLKLDQLWNKFEPVFKKKLGKIVYDVWNEKN